MHLALHLAPMSVLEASWEHHGSTTLLSRPACQGLAPVLILGLEQAEESPPPDPLMEGWALDPQHQRGAFRCSRDPQLWAFGGSRSHRTCLTSCSSQTQWQFFFLEGHPSCSLPVRGVGEAATPRGPSVREEEWEVEGGRSLLPGFGLPSIFVSGSLSVGVLSLYEIVTIIIPPLTFSRSESSW